MDPDAIVIFPAGIVQLPKGGWRTTTYEERDAFGTLGGRDRVEVGALLAKQYPNAYVVTVSQTLGRPTPTLAQVYADELVALGVARERIVQEESSDTTQSGLQTALQVANQREWKQLMFVSSGYHIPRIEAFYHQSESNITTTFIASESVLAQEDSTFAENFEKVKASPAYAERLASEARGVAAIKSGTYRSASIEDKKGRP